MNRRQFICESVAAGLGLIAISELCAAQSKFPVRQMDGKVYFAGPLARADVVNGNRRIYSRALLERVVANMQNSIQNRCCLGQIGMPAGITELNRLQEVSHIVTDLKMQGDYMVAEIEVLDTPRGEVLRSMIKDAPNGLALRTVGNGSVSVNEDGIAVINDNFKLININVVSINEATRIY